MKNDNIQKISYHNLGTNIVMVFETEHDHQSYLSVNKNNDLKRLPTDIIILNHPDNIAQTFPILDKYKYIHLFLDDSLSGGDKRIEKLLIKYPNAIDCNIIYRFFKAINNN